MNPRERLETGISHEDGESRDYQSYSGNVVEDGYECLKTRPRTRYATEWVDHQRAEDFNRQLRSGLSSMYK